MLVATISLNIRGKLVKPLDTLHLSSDRSQMFRTTFNLQEPAIMHFGIKHILCVPYSLQQPSVWQHWLTLAWKIMVDEGRMYCQCLSMLRHFLPFVCLKVMLSYVVQTKHTFLAHRHGWLSSFLGPWRIRA